MNSAGPGLTILVKMFGLFAYPPVNTFMYNIRAFKYLLEYQQENKNCSNIISYNNYYYTVELDSSPNWPIILTKSSHAQKCMGKNHME